MKICSTCNKNLSLRAFSKNPSKKDGLNYVCKECQRKYFNNWYSTNKSRVVKNLQRWNQKNRLNIEQKLIEYFKTHLCVDCGEDDILVLDFDHLEDKVNCISNMIGHGYSWNTIKKEIEKCEVRCSNCHRRKTAKETKNWKWKHLSASIPSVL